MKRIAIDMDEVIADALSAMLGAYNREFAEALTIQDLQGRGLPEAVHPDRRSKIEDYCRAEDFFRHLEVIPDSREVIAELNVRHEVFITTAAMEYPSSFTSKYAWLQEHFPFIPASRIVFCGSKSIIRADYLIDDNVRHFQSFVGQGILFTAPHNIHETSYPRVHSWRGVAALFSEL